MEKREIQAGALLTILTVLRCPGSLLTPQFYAEDGAVFFQQAYNEGFLSSFFHPTAGYLNTLPRMMVGPTLLAPLEWAPLVMTVAALIVQMLPVFYLLSARSSAFLPSFPARLLVAAAYAAMPNAKEIYLTGTNSQWHLTPAILIMLLATPPVSRAARFVDATLLAIFAFTGPPGLILLPLLPFYLRRTRAQGHPRWGVAVATILAIGAAVQAWLLATGGRIVSGPTSPATNVTGEQLIRILSTHALYDVILGEQRFSRLHGSFGLPLHLLGLAILVCLGVAVVRFRPAPLLALGYLALTTIAFSLFFPTNDLVNWLKPHFGQRYYFYATLFVVFSIAYLLGRRGIWRAFGLVLAVPLVGLSFTSDFFRERWPDTRYRDQVAEFRTLPAGESYFIPTFPDGWGMRLVRKSGDSPAESPLARLKPLARETVTTLNPIEVVADRGLVVITGRAIDFPAHEPAGGVFLLVDGKAYPASYGRTWSFRAGQAASVSDTTFRRLIPLADLGTGAHEVSVIVLTHDRKSYFQPQRLSAVVSAGM